MKATLEPLPKSLPQWSRASTEGKGQHRSEPFFLNLPGLAGVCHLSDRAALDFISDALTGATSEILAVVTGGKLPQAARVALAQSMCIAQTIRTKNGFETALDFVASNEMTPWEKLATGLEAGVAHQPAPTAPAGRNGRAGRNGAVKLAA